MWISYKLIIKKNIHTYVFGHFVHLSLASLNGFRPFQSIPHYGARGQNPGHRKIFLSIIESFCFKHHVLSLCDLITFGFMTQGGARGKNLGHLQSANNAESDQHIWTIGSIHGWLPHDSFIQLRQCSRWLEIKIFEIWTSSDLF